MITRYCDILLKKSSKNPEEAELEDTLNQVPKWILNLSCIFKGLYCLEAFFSQFICIAGDGGVQVHRGQGCVPKVLQQDAGEETGKNSVNCI